MAELSQISIQLLEWKESIPRKSDLFNDFFGVYLTNHSVFIVMPRLPYLLLQ